MFQILPQIYINSNYDTHLTKHGTESKNICNNLHTSDKQVSALFLRVNTSF